MEPRDPQREAWIDRVVAQLDLPQLLAQLVVPYVSGSSADHAHEENRRRFGVASPAEVISRYAFGGVLYFAWADNTGSPPAVAELSRGLQEAALTSGAGVPLTVATDQETGASSRILAPATVLPGAMALGATGAPGLTEDAFMITGRELRAMGINLDYAPTADVNVNPANPVIGVRSFGSDPEIVAEHVAAAVRGLQNARVSATAKHFPGHGDTAVDSHAALPVITHDRATWTRVDAPPFRAAIGAGVDSIMTAHVAVPELEASGEPATLSAAVINGLLRDELGYPGVIVTDSLRMEGVRQRHDDGEVGVRALLAGADVLLDPPEPQLLMAALVRAAESGRLDHDQLLDRVRRVLAMKWDRGVVADPWPAADLSVVGNDDHLDRARWLTAASITRLGGDGPLLRSGSVLVVGADQDDSAALAGRLQAGHRVTTMITKDESDPERLAAVANAAADHDQVVLLTTAAWRSAGQQQVLASIRTVTEPVLVALTDPYDAQLTNGPRLLTYSRTPVSIAAAADVLLGLAAAPGRSPVELLPAPDETD